MRAALVVRIEHMKAGMLYSYRHEKITKPQQTTDKLCSKVYDAFSAFADL